MSTVVLASAKGSPGVTTTALALASWWPREVVLVEADPAGGDVAARLGLAEEPGLVGLAAALRRHRGAPLDSEVLDRYQRESPIGARVVTAPAGSQQATAAVSLLAAQGAGLSLSPTSDVLVDMGRLSGPDASHRSLAASQLARGADLVVWICRPQLVDLAHVATMVGYEQSGEADVVIVLCGNGPYPASEVAATLERPVLGPLPTDTAGAAALWEGKGKTWAHSTLSRATRDLAGTLAARIAQVSGDEADEADEPDDIVSGLTSTGELNDGVHSELLAVQSTGGRP